MLAVSAEFLQAIKNKALQDVRLEFSNGDVIGTSDIAITSGGLNYTEILNGETDVTFGRAVMSELSAVLINADGRFTAFDFFREFTAKIGVKVGDSFEYVALGVFKGVRPEKVRGKLIDFTAHDRMSLFDRSAASFADGLTFPCTLGEIFTKLCDFCGVGYISSVFINSDKTFDANPLEDTDYTCRNILGWIAEAAGSYARMSRDGAVELVWFSTADYTVSRTDRFEMSESEFETPPIDKLEVYNSYGDQLNTSGTGDVVYGISDNPFLYIENDTQLAGLQPYVDAIYSRIASLPAYQPSSFRAEFNPAVQCGDIISVVDDYDVTISFPVFVQTITWTGFAKATYENTGGVIRQNAPFTQRELEQLKKKSVKTQDLWAYIDSYINSDEGVASINMAIGGKFVTEDQISGFITESELKAGVDAYINGEEGIARLTDSLSGVFVTTGEYNKSVHISATSQVFVKAAGASSYTPSSITLTAETKGEGLSLQWYLNDREISGATTKTLTITSDSFSGSSAAYKVIATDSDGNTFTDIISIAKLADGANGDKGDKGDKGDTGDKGDKGDNGADGYTVLLSNEFIEIPVGENRYPTAAASHTCTVSVYKGLTALSGFTVAVSSKPSGVTATVSGTTVTISVNTTTAIADTGNVMLAITAGSMTIYKAIVVRANMNALTSTGYEKTVLIDGGMSKIYDYIEGTFTLNLYAESKVEENFSETDVGTMDEDIVLFPDGDTNAYGFTSKDLTGYYTSTNAGIAYSCSYMKLEFNFDQPTAVTFRCICLGETTYDYGLISNVDCDLAVSYLPDDYGGILSSDVFYSFRGQHSVDPVDVVMMIPAGSHYVTVKYCKDSGYNATGDYFKFRAFATQLLSTNAQSHITLKAGPTGSQTELAAADIVLQGLVTFESLSTPGATVIDGANVKTENLYVQNVFLGGDNSRKIITSSLGTSGGEVDIGFIDNYGSSSYGKVVKIYADYLYIVPPGGSETDDNVLMISTKDMYFGANSADWTFDI